MIVHREHHYSGRVQGVGFRYTVKQIAAGYNVVGWVRNLPDGRVGLQVSGESDELDAFFQAIADSHLGGYIKTATGTDMPPPSPAFTGFEISH